MPFWFASWGTTPYVIFIENKTGLRNGNWKSVVAVCNAFRIRFQLTIQRSCQSFGAHFHSDVRLIGVDLSRVYQQRFVQQNVALTEDALLFSAGQLRRVPWFSLGRFPCGFQVVQRLHRVLHWLRDDRTINFSIARLCLYAFMHSLKMQPPFPMASRSNFARTIHAIWTRMDQSWLTLWVPMYPWWCSGSLKIKSSRCDLVTEFSGKRILLIFVPIFPHFHTTWYI